LGGSYKSVQCPEFLELLNWWLRGFEVLFALLNFWNSSVDGYMNWNMQNFGCRDIMITADLVGAWYPGSFIGSWWLQDLWHCKFVLEGSEFSNLIWILIEMTLIPKMVLVRVDLVLGADPSSGFPKTRDGLQSETIFGLRAHYPQ